MMQESGGQGTDPMQCSECGFNTRYPHYPNGITDPEYSIDVGIQNLADCLHLSDVESPIDLAVVVTPPPMLFMDAETTLPQIEKIAVINSMPRPTATFASTKRMK